MNLPIRLLIPFFLACIPLCKAQHDSLPTTKADKGFFLFSAGLADPLGDLASHNFRRSSSGMANPGLALNFSYQKSITKYLGILVSFHRESFFLDEEEFSRLNQASLPEGYTVDVEVQQNWSISGLQFGLKGNIPLNSDKTWFFEPRLLLGLCRGKSPGMVFTLDSVVPKTEPIYTETLLSTRSANLPGSFLIGLALRYNTPSNWCFTFELDYSDLLAELEFNDLLYTNSLQQNASAKRSMDAKFYCLRLGIGKLIGR